MRLHLVEVGARGFVGDNTSAQGPRAMGRQDAQWQQGNNHRGGEVKFLATAEKAQD